MLHDLILQAEQLARFILQKAGALAYKAGTVHALTVVTVTRVDQAHDASTLAAASAREESLQAMITLALRATSASHMASPTPDSPPVTMQI